MYGGLFNRVNPYYRVRVAYGYGCHHYLSLFCLNGVFYHSFDVYRGINRDVGAFKDRFAHIYRCSGYLA